MKIDGFKIAIAVPIIILTCAIILIQQFVYLPAKAEAEKFDKKYPTQCIIQRNQTVIFLNANDKMTLYKPENVCQVSLKEFPSDNGTMYYYVKYQYESQAKYNKLHDEYFLSCKPKTFDNMTGNWICIDGSIAKEKWVYE